MSSAPGYYEILKKLEQAELGEVSLSDQSWRDLSMPPAPTDINLFPPNPEACIVSTKSLPDRETKPQTILTAIGQVTLVEKYINQSISVIGYYTKHLQGTVTPGMPLKQTIAVTKGTANTESFSTSVEMSLGVSIEGLFDLSAKISTTFGRSITFSESVTQSHEFVISSQSGELSGVWWQAIYEYRLSGTKVIFLDGKEAARSPFLQMLYDNTPSFVATQYPHA